MSPQGQDLVRTSQLSVLEDPGQDRTVRSFAVLARTRRTGPLDHEKMSKKLIKFLYLEMQLGYVLPCEYVSLSMAP